MLVFTIYETGEIVEGIELSENELTTHKLITDSPPPPVHYVRFIVFGHTSEPIIESARLLQCDVRSYINHGQYVSFRLTRGTPTDRRLFVKVVSNPTKNKRNNAGLRPLYGQVTPLVSGRLYDDDKTYRHVEFAIVSPGTILQVKPAGISGENTFFVSWDGTECTKVMSKSHTLTVLSNWIDKLGRNHGFEYARQAALKRDLETLQFLFQKLRIYELPL